jgi:hypothetical protein
MYISSYNGTSNGIMEHTIINEEIAEETIMTVCLSAESSLILDLMI